MGSCLPSKSSATVPGETMLACESIIKVSPRFLPKNIQCMSNIWENMIKKIYETVKKESNIKIRH